MQMGGAAHQQCNTLAKLLCSIYKIQKISQILIETGCNAKTHHMCGQVGPQRHVQHARPVASRTYYGDYGFDIPYCSIFKDCLTRAWFCFRLSKAALQP